MVMGIFHFFLFLAKVQVPDSDGFVIWDSIKILSCWMDSDRSDPVVMASKCGQMLASLTYEEFDKFIPTSSEEEGLMISL